MLETFLDYPTHAWPQAYAADLVDWGHRALLVSAGPAAWRVTVHPDGAQVRPPGTGGAEATVGGQPAAVLLWLYNRRGHSTIQTAGDPEMIGQFKRLLTAGISTN